MVHPSQFLVLLWMYRAPMAWMATIQVLMMAGQCIAHSLTAWVTIRPSISPHETTVILEMVKKWISEKFVNEITP